MEAPKDSINSHRSSHIVVIVVIGYSMLYSYGVSDTGQYGGAS